MINISHILKYAVSVALMLLGIGVSGHAVAIGLGDMDVKSHLGQPLRAKVKVHGINSLEDESCFKLTNTADGSDSLKSANFKLTNLVGEEATLLISSNSVINDPILNVSLITECDATTSVRRDYVLLIDPLLTAEADNNNSIDEIIIPSASKPASAKKTNKRRQATSSSQQNTNNSAQLFTESLPPSAVKSAGTNQTQPQIQSEIKPKTITTNNTPRAIKKESKPHLFISGSSGNANISNNSLALRLDSQLHMTPSEDPQAFSAEAEVLDEVTVMNNRLANLEKQLVTLQNRNITLELADRAHLQQIEQDKEQTDLLRWLAYLLGACALVGVAATADWWRRRNQRLKLDIDSAWHYMDEPKQDSLYLSDNPEDEHFIPDIASVQTDLLNTSTTELDDFDKTVTTPAFMANKVESVIIEEDILDHADVFLSHGRTNLAIQLLQNHLSEYPNRSVTVWLFLLDLLAKEGAEEEYEMAILECKKHFNVELPEFSVPLAKNGNGIESYSAITKHLVHVWQTDEAVAFLDNLIYNNRLQARAGFNQAAFEELALLKSIAQEHQQTAQIIPLFQKAPTIKIESKPPVLKGQNIEKANIVKTSTDNQPNTMPPILLAEEIKETSLETTKETPKATPEETSFEFNLVEWK